MSRKLYIAALALIVACEAACMAACKTTPKSEGDPQALLPAIVLLVAERPDAPRRYGAGVFVDADGTILTNAHLVEGGASLRAMTFDRSRRSYSPLDGGLSRFLFENDRALVVARVLRVDRGADLALVRVDAAPAHRAIALREEAPRIGERVFALGHPQEGVWSVTAGIIAGERDGLIQHDAQLSGGSSGGPLVDGAGRVVGLNTSKVVSEMGGAGFARDVPALRRFLGQTKEGATIDLRQLESAALGCMRAQELSVPETVECLDWDNRYAVYATAIEDARQKLAKDKRDMAKVEAAFARLPGKEQWIAEQKRKVAAFFEGKTKASAEADAGRAAKLQKDGLKFDPFDSAALQTTLKKGLRIEAVHHFSGDRAWVHFNGRNTDDTPYAFSECWQHHGDRWLQHSPPVPDDLRALPAGFPQPLEPYELTRRKFLTAVLDRVAQG
ncbi:MAG: trypsin-like peptidase domain-containing protein [Deltaproteobacteria bacterium]|nr:trypsin-like peptidase domain-containing protein [Deltaproteobacteria bacterium]